MTGEHAATSASYVAHAVCRACHVGCGLRVEMSDGQVTKIYGDKNNPAYFGYSCIKGRQLGAYHSLPTRLLQSRKRDARGGFAPIASGQAIAEIAERLDALIAQYGPRSVALYTGTLGLIHFPTTSFADAFMTAIGSPMRFTTLTIDQPGNVIAPMLHGIWMAGMPAIEQSDMLMLVGVNPLVSLSGGLGPNPARQLKEAKKRGLKLIVIDPRTTESARQADLHLAPDPGHDAAILAGMIRIILDEGLYDCAFVEAETINLDRLRAAVAPFTPEMVAARAGFPADELVAAARMLASGTRGGIRVGTGTNMSGRANLSCYLALTLTTLCGLWRRAGDSVPNPGVLVDHGPWLAAATGPLPAIGVGPEMRVKGFVGSVAGLPTAALPDEILTPGDGQIKALIVLGGNPMLAMPDQIKTFEAMKALDLLVVLDPHMSETARLADYVIAPVLPLEQEGVSLLYEMAGISGMVGFGWGYGEPYAQYVDKLIDPPPGSDLVEDWAFFHQLAAAMKRQLVLKSAVILDPQRAAGTATPLDMDSVPGIDAVWDILTQGSPVPFDTVRANPGPGRIYDVPETRAMPRPPDWPGRLELGDAAMMAELAAVAGEVPDRQDDGFPFRLISRRLHDVHNSNWHDDPALRRRYKTNPAFMHPDDMRRLGLGTGDLARIRSRRAAITGRVEEAPDVKPGCVSMAHCFGRNPDQADDPDGPGANVSRLISVDEDYDPVTGIPRMSAIPVQITRLEVA